MPLSRPVTDNSFALAVERGHLACVKLLVAAGLPREPYLHREWRSPAEAHLLPCLQHMFDMGCRIHPGNMIMAARGGNLEHVRFLRENGIPLWTRACVAAPLKQSSTGHSRFGRSRADRQCVNNNILPIPGDEIDVEEGPEGGYFPGFPTSASEFRGQGPEQCCCSGSVDGTRRSQAAFHPSDGHRSRKFPFRACKFHAYGSKGCYAHKAAGKETPVMFDVLRWAYAHGAPVTPAVDDAIRAMRASTRAVLLALHGATRVRRGDGTQAERAAWASMHAVPPSVVEKIVARAGLEIPESFGRSLPAHRPVEAWDTWRSPHALGGIEEFKTWGYAT